MGGALSESGFAGFGDLRDCRRRVDSYAVGLFSPTERAHRNDQTNWDAPLAAIGFDRGASKIFGRTLSESGFAGFGDLRDCRRRVDSYAVGLSSPTERAHRNDQTNWDAPLAAIGFDRGASKIFGRTLSESGFAGFGDLRDCRRRVDSYAVGLFSPTERAHRNDQTNWDAPLAAIGFDSRNGFLYDFNPAGGAPRCGPYNSGAIAQLGERYNGIVEVKGSSPFSST